MLNFRRYQAQDEAFIKQLFFEVKISQFELMPLTEHQIGQLLEQQFDLQLSQYIANYGEQDFYILELDNHPIGRLFCHVSAYEILIVDITILQQYRNQGFGQQALKQLQALASQKGQAIRLNVDINNPARGCMKKWGLAMMAKIMTFNWPWSGKIIKWINE